MKARTNLSSIKALAQHFLMMDIKTTPHSSVIVSHPFTDMASSEIDFLKPF